MTVPMENEHKPFGKQTQFFEDMVQYFQPPRLLLFFFSPFSWFKHENTIPGLTFDGERWRQAESKKPSLVYDRSFSTDAQSISSLVAIRHAMVQEGVEIFNAPGIQDFAVDKLITSLWQESHGMPYLAAWPLPRFLDSPPLQSGTSYYIKPIRGSRGQGVMRLKCHSRSLELTEAETNRTYGFNSTIELSAFLDKAVDKSNYMAQEAADIYPFEGRPFDMRVIVQRQGEGFKMAGSGIRLGENSSIVSNLSAGGSAISTEEFIERYLAASGQDLSAHISKAVSQCLDFTHKLSEELGELVELGFDVLLTQNKGPIILEVNAKPSRWLFVQIADHQLSQGHDPLPFMQLRKRTVTNPLKYALTRLSDGKGN